VRPVEATEEALCAGPCKEFLPESEGRVGYGLGIVETPKFAACLLVGGGTRKEDGLVSPEDGVER
jgi:hypothetical protein